MPLTLRLAEPADAPEVARLHVAAWRAAYEGLLPADVLDGLDSVARAAGYTFGGPPGGDVACTVVAVDEEGIAGFVTIGPCGEVQGTGEVHALYVEPGRWRRGIGGALLGEACDRLSTLGYREAMLWVLAGNARAERFYLGEGWMPDGGRRTEPLDACWVSASSGSAVIVDEVRYRTSLP